MPVVFPCILVFLLVIVHWYRRSKRPNSLLPLFLLARESRRPSTLTWSNIKVETSRFNQPHALLSNHVAAPRHLLLRQVFTATYNIGIVVAVLGQCATLVMLAWISVSLFVSMLPLSPSETDAAENIHASIAQVRSLHNPTTSASFSHSSFHLLIPGLTVPFSHILPLVLALFCNQVVHEAGHALAAALESVPLLSCGVSLAFFIPAAFVSLPHHTVQALPPLGRLRILAAGPFHNVLLWLLVYIVSTSGLRDVVWSLLGYDNVGKYGRVVMDVHAESPLSTYIPIGSVITKLNDQQVHAFNTTIDVWDRYLNLPPDMREQDTLGWCTNENQYMNLDTSCCSPNSATSDFTCFVAQRSSLGAEISRCLSPLFLSASDYSSTVRRCSGDIDCHETEICILPRPDQDLLRIELLLPRTTLADYNDELDSRLRTILWNGPRTEVLEDVHVGRFWPRYFFLPRQMPELVSLLTSYLSMLALSLYLFNLLPFPILDGGPLLAAALDLLEDVYCLRSDENAMEDMERASTVSIHRSRTQMERRKKKVAEMLRTLTMVLLVICTILGLTKSLTS